MLRRVHLISWLGQSVSYRLVRGFEGPGLRHTCVPKIGKYVRLRSPWRWVSYFVDFITDRRLALLSWLVSVCVIENWLSPYDTHFWYILTYPGYSLIDREDEVITCCVRYASQKGRQQTSHITFVRQAVWEWRILWGRSLCSELVIH